MFYCHAKYLGSGSPIETTINGPRYHGCKDLKSCQYCARDDLYKSHT